MGGETDAGTDATPDDAGGAGGAGEPGAVCSSAWCWSHPLPHGQTVTSVWADNAGTIWVGGDAGTLMRSRNGGTWEGITSDAIDGTIGSLWGSGPNDIWATNNRLLFRFDGTSWRKVPYPSGAAADGLPWFTSLSGSGANDVWLSSANGVYHWNGAAWSDGYLTDRDVLFVSAASASEVWALDSDRLYKWNDATFVVVNWSGSTPFQGVYAIGPNDVWANANGDLWHWDGRQFTREAGIFTSGAYLQYDTVFATTPGDVWALNDNFKVPYHRVSAGNWSALAYEADDAAVYPRVGTGIPSGGAWLGGGRGRVWKYDTDRFKLIVPPIDPLAAGDLNAIWSDGNGTTIAVGGPPLRNAGGGWQPIPIASGVGVMNALWGRSATDVWGVGPGGGVYHYDGTMWSVVATGLPSTTTQNLQLYTLGGTATGELWALGTGGQVLHFDGQTWTVSASAATSTIRGLWVHDADDIWACGQNGVVQRWTRAAGWAQLTARPPVVMDYRTIWGTSPTDVWIVSGTSSTFHYDGAAWKTVPPPANLDSTYAIYALAGSPDGTFWAAGEKGAIMRWDGSVLQMFNSHSLSELRGLWVGANGEAWAAGAYGGTILHHR